MTDTPTDLVNVSSLDELDRAYLRRSEVASGQVSRATVTERRRSAEGRALAKMRRDGETLYVRAVLDRPGEPRALTTEVASVIDLTGETRGRR